MRSLLVTFLVFAYFVSFGQEIGKCVQILGEDSVQFFFNGVLCDKECAKYYRTAKLNHYLYFFEGSFKDYYSSGQVAVEGSYLNNLLQGSYKAFYGNGQLKESGQWQQGYKTGEWKYWYENGQLKKVIRFNGQDYYLQEFYKSNGKRLTFDGHGEFSEIDLLPKTLIRGEIKNGKQHGKWTIYIQNSNYKVGVEVFENGRFIEGENIAEVAGFSHKYFDAPTTLIDRTEDLLGNYSQKTDCVKLGATHSYQVRRYNSPYSDLPFYDYVYQRFDPPYLEKGYILVGFTINKSGKLINPILHSTLHNTTVEKQLVDVLTACETWAPRTHNDKAMESDELLVLQFLPGTYKILGDSRNSFPAIEYSAEFIYGRDSLQHYIEQKIDLPSHFFSKDFQLACTIDFDVDEKGNCNIDNSLFSSRLRITEQERILYNALNSILKKTSSLWKPSIKGATPTKQHFIGILTIKNGIPKFRWISNNLVLN
ncbi:hypothetical protein Q0590_24175 [Rhodocytophaga aerolata]|uniref:TonB C-terminal domain-containing protein n=1 Tax=Rhodocytophaga aerolata TaxID=455078 RepID=A0ABT8RF50_9BACT|nr:hypothetical protein [Rhodocytophaga aerolata]MDO1449395.1 hypothetical protein [Rhodocytophaga aerolata]